MTRIVVFDLECLSIRSAGCYGNVETPTPLLNEFAAQAMLFEQHYRSYTATMNDLESAIGSFPETLPVSLLSETTLFSELGPRAVTQFETTRQLTPLLEERLERDNTAAWVRLSAREDTIDSTVPLQLISALVEQGVQVAITSTSPTTDALIRDAATVRVPLMVWTGEPSRIQTVTSTTRLANVLGLTGADHDEPEVAVIRSTEHVAMREPESLVIASRSLLSELSDVCDDRLADHIDMTSERVQLFRKPEDVWNVHSVLVEEPLRGVEALSRLRKLLTTLEP